MIPVKPNPWLLVFLVACGGTTTDIPDAADDGSADGNVQQKDGATTIDATTIDGGGGGPCPVSLPTNGATCSSAGLDCEYGSDKRLECNDWATCAQGVWQVNTGADCLEFTDGGGGCPIDRSSIQPGSDCTLQNVVCGYADSVCACGFSGHPPKLQWVCDGPQTDPGCPSPRPELGTACQSVAQIICDYGACSALGGNSEVCKNGTWHYQGTPCPP